MLRDAHPRPSTSRARTRNAGADGGTLAYFIYRRLTLFRTRMEPLAQPRYTPEQYLALERKAPFKSELINGRIYAMSGATRAHDYIAGNVYMALRLRFRGRPCDAFTSDMRVTVRATGLFTYPDVSAVCGEAAFGDTAADTLVNPQLIVEVLSDSTEKYDRGEKFAHYRRLESLRDYVLISQHTMRVEHYSRRGETWVLTELAQPGSVLRIDSVDCDVPLADIYERVEFPPSASRFPAS
jgi:Uma2 family endonuclease